jgi:hypothetical protein
MGQLNFDMINKKNDFYLDMSPDASYQAEQDAYKDDINKASKEVVIKLSFMPTLKTKDQMLLFESKLYTKVISNLLDWGYTPHVMLPITSYTCDDIQEQIQKLPDQDREIVEKQQEMIETDMNDKGRPDSLDFTRAHVLVLEKGMGSDLQDWIANNVLDMNFMSILFQVFWTIETFNEIGIRHNDLHFGNIWVEELETPQYYFYFVDQETYFAVPIKYFVKVYDFDHTGVWSSKLVEWTEGKKGKLVSSKLRNKDLDRVFCKDFGQCNTKNTKFDMFMVLYEIYRRVRGIRTWLYWVTKFFYGKTDLLEVQFGGNKGTLCELDTRKKKPACNGNYVPDDKIMWSSRKILLEGFKFFKKSLPQFDQQHLPDVEYNRFYFMPGVNQSTLDNKLTAEETTGITLPEPLSVLSMVYNYD